MVSIGMVLNGFTVSSAVMRYRAGKGEEVIILGIREHEHGTEWVIADIPLREVQSDSPATFWNDGRYFDSRNGDDAVSVTRSYSYATGIASDY